MYLQNIVCVALVLHSQIVRTNILTNIDTQTYTQGERKHYHLAIAGDKDRWASSKWFPMKFELSFRENSSKKIQSDNVTRT